MINSGKVWNNREAYQNQRANTWETPGNIGIRLGGQTTPAASESNTVEYVNMTSTGNTADFGDLSVARKKSGGAGGFTRVQCIGGQTPSQSDVIDFVNPVATGNFSDFGNLRSAGQVTNISHCNNIIAISADGNDDANGIVYTNLASQGNSSMFGDRTIDNTWAVGTGDNTRFIMGGRYPASNVMDYVEIVHTGNATDFGDMSGSFWGRGAFSNSTRSIFAGGYSPSASNVIDYVTTQTTGNTTDFGDLTSTDYIDAAGASNSTRGIIFGYQVNTIDTVNIATTGNATDFGDTLTSTFYQIAAVDNGGGGLPQEGVFPQRPSVNYMPGSGRGLVAGGEVPGSPGRSTQIEMIYIPTLGAVSDFGTIETSSTRGLASGSVSNNIKGIYAGGYSGSAANKIGESIFATTGNGADFGDLTVARFYLGSCSSATRGIFAGGSTPTKQNVIDYITIASAGDATDFGDMPSSIDEVTATSSPVRGVIFGGQDPSKTNEINYVTIASTGNATDFGDLTESVSDSGACGSSTRGLRMGGEAPSNTNVIDYVTIASTGNAIDFGDMTISTRQLGGMSTNTRGLHVGGYPLSNTIGYVTIASTGNAADYGDLTQSVGASSYSSDSHGGLQSS